MIDRTDTDSYCSILCKKKKVCAKAINAPSSTFLLSMHKIGLYQSKMVVKCIAGPNVGFFFTPNPLNL